MLSQKRNPLLQQATPVRAAEGPLKTGTLKQPWFAMGVEITYSNKGSIPDLERCVMLKID